MFFFFESSVRRVQRKSNAAVARTSSKGAALLSLAAFVLMTLSGSRPAAAHGTEYYDYMDQSRFMPAYTLPGYTADVFTRFQANVSWHISWTGWSTLLIDWGYATAYNLPYGRGCVWARATVRKVGFNYSFPIAGGGTEASDGWRYNCAQRLPNGTWTRPRISLTGAYDHIAALSPSAYVNLKIEAGWSKGPPGSGFDQIVNKVQETVYPY